MSSQTEISQIGDLMAFTILFYDHVLTFPAEMRYFWRRPRYNLGFGLFFINRYFALCLHIFNVIRIFTQVWPDDNKQNCATMEITERAGVVVAQLFCAVIMAIRVYVLYKRSRIILVSLSIVAVGTLCFSFKPHMFNRGSGADMAILWGGQLLFDAIIFVLTLSKSYCLGTVGDHSLVDILLRDGAIYFAIISGVNAANIAILLVNYNLKSISGMFTNSVNVIMVSRLVLNLQESSLRGSAENTEHSLLPMTTIVPFDDGLLAMRADDS
ncbi:hypothetical protein EV363DRAFT_1209571 [Boletus edulis]|nr:hypothetical protein EV363DRAFT_1209571 [Boletus edulis]